MVTRQANINRYNNGWLRIQIDVADDYDCASDCWWTLRYDVTDGLGPNDRTVWKVAVVDLDADRRGDHHHHDDDRTRADDHHVDGAGPARLAEEPPAVHDAVGLNRSTAAGGRGILDGSGSLHVHGGRRRPGRATKAGPYRRAGRRSSAWTR